MSRPLLILRPDPASTAARAAARGMQTVAAPLFTIVPVAWEAPDPAGYDAVMMTSANAARHGGPALALYRHLPLHAVGATTAAAARAAGFAKVTAGAADAAALLAGIAATGARRLLHFAGREHRQAEHGDIQIDRRIVYAADAALALPEAARVALAAGAVALFHSPRAAVLFRKLAEEGGVPLASIRIAAISPAALAAAGPGWAGAVAADRPGDDPLLAAAARLCD